MGAGALALTLLGATLYWPFLRRNVLFYSLAGHAATTSQSMFWLATCLVLECVAVSFARAFERRRGPVGDARRLPLVLCGLALAQSACKCGELYGQARGVAAVILAAADVVLFAFLFVGLTYAWASRFVALGPRASCWVVLASFASSFLVKRLSYAPQPWGTLLMVFVPVACALCWAASEPAVRAAGPARLPGARPVADESAAADPGGVVASQRGAVALLVVFLVASGMLRGFLPGELDGEIRFESGWRDLMTVVCAALLFVCYRVTPSQGQRFRRAWSVGTIVIFVGLLVMTGLGSAQLYTGQQIVIMGRTCLGVFFWVVLADGERARRIVQEGGAGRSGGDAHGATRSFAWVFVLVDAVTAAFGYVLIPLLRDALGLSLVGSFATLATFVTFVLVVVLIVSFVGVMPGDGSRAVPAAGDSGAEPEPVLPRRSADDWARGLRATYGLTEREAETAALLADGNSQKRVSEILGVSLGTAQSHIRSVYRKLDIHSRQDLIDLAHRACNS